MNARFPPTAVHRDGWFRVSLLTGITLGIVKARDRHDAFAKVVQMGIVPAGTALDIYRTGALLKAR